MSNSELPAGGAGGPVPVPDLPEKMRVHALAKLLGRTSREVLTALADLSIEVRGAQSSIDRKAAEQVVTALAGPGAPAAPIPAAEPPAAEPPAAEPPAAESPAAEVEQAAAEAPAAPARARRAPLTPVFAPPAPLFQAPTRPARTPRRAAPAEDVAADEVTEEAATPPARRSTPRAATPADEAETSDTAEDTSPAAGTDDDSDDEDSAARRRRRRGRRGRGRGRTADENGADEGGTDESDENDDDSEEGAESGTAEESGADADRSADAESGSEGEGDSEGDDGQGDADSTGSRRRRRRRRRKGSDDGDATDEADPPNTVTRVRAPREAREQRSEDTDGDGVQSVRGSTRLEAKRQRRRDGRDAGRRRVPILSEAEFLARRESVDRTMVVRERGDRVEIGVLEDDVLVEHFVNNTAGRDGGAGKSLVGNIYLGRVQNVLPSMEAAFVDIGRGRNAVLYAGEVDWDAAGLGGKARRIEQALSSGDPVLVQVTKDPIGHKGARLTTQISLAGRFLVYVPSGGAAGISRKLPDVERKRLKDMLKEIVPSEAGVIIRTASEGVSHEALERDVRRLQAQWEVVRTRSEQTGPNKPKAPVLLYEEPDLLIKVVRDQFNEDFSRLVIEGDDAWDTLHNYIGHVAPELVDRLHRHVGSKDVFGEYRIDEQLLKALDRKVWLPSGGTLVIDRTEAMTVIDVNTGKFTGSGGNLEETVTRNNLEAAEEVVRQLRLRDIGGIIVIDFIDMVLEANRDLVLRRLTECLSRDRTRHQVAEVTSLGLVQMTRKRVGGGLLEHFSTPCEHCRGRGVVVAVEPVSEKASGSDRGAGAERTDGPDREGSGRRSRGRGRGRDSQQGESPQAESPQAESPQGDSQQAVSPQAVSPQAESPQGDSGVAGTDVGAPTPVVEPSVAVVEAAPPAPATPAPATPAPAPPAPAAPTPAAVAPVLTSTGADPVADAVEEVVVERSVTAQAADTAPAVVDEPPAPAAAEPAAAQDGGAQNGVPQDDGSGPRNGQARPRRRGRVTRTAGAPAAATGDAPAVAVVTVPADGPASDGPVSDGPGAEPVSAPVAPQPEPTVVSRPRRARRAASRPAGPPVADAPVDGAATAGGDPV